MRALGQADLVDKTGRFIEVGKKSAKRRERRGCVEMKEERKGRGPFCGRGRSLLAGVDDIGREVGRPGLWLL